MAANWASGTDPQLSSTYANVINSIRERDEDVAKQFNNPSNNSTLGTNHVIGTIRWDGSAKKWQVGGSGGSWAALASEYDIDVTTIKGCAPNNSSGASNLPRNNGTLQTNLIAQYLGTSGYDSTHFKNATNLTAGTLHRDRLSGTYDITITGNTTTFSVAQNNSNNETVYPIFVDGATGAQGAETDTGLSYNPSTGYLSATRFVGSSLSLTGISTTIQNEINTKAELAGSASQIFSAVTAAAGTNTTQVATTAFVKNIADTKALLAGSASQTFSASTASAGTNTTQVATTAFVTTGLATKQATLVNITDGSSANGRGNRTVSLNNPSGGSNGDLWYKV